MDLERQNAEVHLQDFRPQRGQLQDIQHQHHGCHRRHSLPINQRLLNFTFSTEILPRLSHCDYDRLLKIRHC